MMQSGELRRPCTQNIVEVQFTTQGSRSGFKCEGGQQEVVILTLWLYLCITFLVLILQKVGGALLAPFSPPPPQLHAV